MMIDDRGGGVQTTLALDDDVLAAAKELAAMQKKSIGEVVSSLVRNALRPVEPGAGFRNGVPLLAVRPDASRVSSELVRQLDDKLP